MEIVTLPALIADPLPRRRQSLLAVLAFSLPMSAMYCALNVRHGATALALANALVGAGSLALLVLVLRRPERTTLAGLLYLVLLIGNIALGLAYPHAQPGIHAWLPGIPVICYLLLGPRPGFWLTWVFLATVNVGYLYSARTHPEYLSVMGLANVWVPTLTLFILIHFYARSRARTEGALRRHALRDPLTGLANRTQLMENFEREVTLARYNGTPLSLVLIDLDHFKRVNDRHGHDAGDAALVFVSDLLGRRLRQSDTLARLGGEEFLALLPGTDAAGALALAEELRAVLDRSRFHHHGRDIHLTLSAGVVEFGRDGATWEALYQTADQRLYACKRSGRNRVLSQVPEAPLPAVETDQDAPPQAG